MIEHLEGRRLLSLTPFTGVPVVIPGTVQAENFDNGGEGVAYHDTTPVQKGNAAAYRATSVDIQTTPGGYNVGYISAGEWLKFTINVSSTAGYQLDARVASASGGGTLHVSFDDVNKTGAMTLANTGNWKTWTTVTKTGISLTAGMHVMKVSIDSAVDSLGVGNIDWIKLTKLASGSGSPTKFSWTQAASSPLGRYEAAGVAVGGRLYVFGGYVNASIQGTKRSDVYDPATNKWTRIADMPEQLTHCGQVVDGSSVWLIGGFVGDNPGPATQHVWRYDTLTNTWSAGPALPAARGAGAAAIVGRAIHFFGGLTHAYHSWDPVTVDQREHWILQLGNQGAGWKPAAPMINPRNHLAGISFNGKVYAIGGQHLWDEEAGAQSEVDVYDPATDKWTQLASLPLARSHISASTFIRNGSIFVVGGSKNDHIALSDVLIYNPATNTWSASSTPLPAARLTPVAADIFGKVVVATGSPEDNEPAATTWIGTAV
jgi:N-acetylneuraminic acid mutarotase